MNWKIMLCLAAVIFMVSACLAVGPTSQTASNSATVNGNANSVSQSNTQYASGGAVTQSASNDANVQGSGNTLTQGNTQIASGPGSVAQTGSNTVKMVITYPADSYIMQRVLYNNVWMLGPAAVCEQDSLLTAIKNDRNQLVRVHEKYPNGAVVTSDWSYSTAGEVMKNVFIGDAIGVHKLRAEGSVSGLSPDIITIEVVPCGYVGVPVGGSGWTTQSASNSATVQGSGNSVNQGNTQTSYGGGSQTASNDADIFGDNNNVGQSNTQTSYGGGSQTASNDADIFGDYNTVNQQNKQKKYGSGSQSASNDADIFGSGNSVGQSNEQVSW